MLPEIPALYTSVPMAKNILTPSSMQFVSQFHELERRLALPVEARNSLSTTCIIGLLKSQYAIKAPLPLCLDHSAG